jgi:hypothetical protein
VRDTQVRHRRRGHQESAAPGLRTAAAAPRTARVGLTPTRAESAEGAANITVRHTCGVAVPSRPVHSPKERPDRSRREHRAARQVPRRDAALGDAGNLTATGTAFEAAWASYCEPSATPPQASKVRYLSRPCHHMPATPAWGNQASRIGMDSRLVWLLVQALTMSVEAKITKVITCRSLSDRTNR